MRPVYSTTFIRAGHTVGSATLVYTVPTGFTAVIRSMDIFHQGTLTVVAYPYIATSHTGSGDVALWQETMPATTSPATTRFHWDGHVAIPAAGTIKCATGGAAGANCAYTISGFLLTN